nr:hypothetical protein [Tanacetum cinerariifolium]
MQVINEKVSRADGVKVLVDLSLCRISKVACHFARGGVLEVLMMDWLSIVKTDKVIHTVKTDIVKLMVEIESFGMSSDKFDEETGSSDGLQPKQADMSYVHALNKLHLHEIRVVPSKHEADQY